MLQTAAEPGAWAGMKRPLSPSHSPESAVQLVEEASCPPSQPEQRMKREKKHQSFTLCEVCNIQLNSAAQAQIHYNGKSHQKRLKQLNKGKMPAAQGPSGHSSPLLASLPIPGRPLHPPLDIKHFLTFRLNGASPLNLFPNFNTMDPVQKAVISHTFGVPAPLKKKQFISCNICHLRFNSANQAEAHYKGHKHARRLKAIEAMKNKQKVVGAAAGTPGQDSTADLAPSPVGSGELGSTADASNPQESEGEGSSLGLVPSAEEPPVELPGTVAPLGSPPASELSEGTSDATSVASSSAQAAEAQTAESGSSISSAPESEKEGKKSKQHLYCPTCKVTVNSLSQLEAHNTGAKHKSMLEGHGTQLRRGRGKLLSRAGHKSKRIGNKGSINIQNKAFHCQVCEIYVNSETQLKQHMSSRRHKDRLAGKPPKPKYSPYNKLQKNAALASKLALQKHLTKTLATRFLPSPLTAAAVCAMPGPLALRPAAATTLFQAPILGPALFRTPPPHVRPTPGPIVFAPY
ncbi:zinc finger protein 385C isoform X1 [Parus major]|uniref:zinc finger protein 385C isoform X1 n=1 Tax=Parus major TaxID=9157 RepID=UPI00077100B7|nr:zinc finger protein 385C isoform X1 [Parus major]